VTHRAICSLLAASALVTPAATFAQTSASQPAEAAIQSDPKAQARQGRPSPPAASTGLEEIVVTAQRREETLQEVPISIVSLGAAQLGTLNIKRFTDIGFQVPALRLSQHPTTPFATRLFIRGIGNNDAQISQDPGVGVYVDGVYIARSTGLTFDFGDIERLEVLRGPQGTLYGRNTIGGALNIVTRRPSGDPGMTGELTYGSKDLIRGQARADLPRFGGIATSVTALYAKRDGLVKNDGVGKNFGAYDRWGVRLAADADLSDTINAYLTYEHSVDHSTPYYYQAIGVVGGPPNFYDFFIPDEPKRVTRGRLAAPVKESRLRIDGATLTLAWTPRDELTLKSITAYREFSARVYADFSANPAFSLFQTNMQVTHQHQFSQELQALGEAADGRLEYIAGAYFFSEKARQPETYTAGAFVINDHLTRARNRAQALFANITYALDDTLKLTLGGRYSWDQRRGSKDNVDFTIPDEVTGELPSQFFASGSKRFHKFNPSGNLSWQPTEDINLYAKITTGYRAGGFGTGAASKADFERGFGPENLTSYEAGLKLRSLDRRVQVNSALYYAKYSDALIDIAVFGQPQFVASFNAGKARIWGAEFDVILLPTPTTRIELSYAHTSAKYNSVVDPQTGNDVTREFRFPNTPKHGFSVTANQTLGEIGTSPLDLNINYAWQSKVLTTAPFRERPGARIKAYGLLNARLSLSDIAVGGSLFKLSLWGRNLADKHYMVDNFGSLPWTPKLTAFGEPRTLGIDLSFAL